jgi:hypothetical protein
MLPHSKISALFAPLVLAVVTYSAAAAQQLSAGDQKAMVAAGRAQYYNLRAAGLKSFHCDIELDWEALITAASGKTPPADDPMIRYLKSTRLGIQDDLLTTPVVEWAASGVPPEGQEKRGDQMRDGLRQMIGGFLTAWSPSLNGTLIPLNPSTFQKTPGGYEITDVTGAAKARIELDKDMKVTHISSSTDAIVGDLDTTFTPTKNGLVLTRMVSLTRQPPAAPPVSATMTATFEPTSEFLLPATLKIVITNVLSVDMQFDHCTVQRIAP